MEYVLRLDIALLVDDRVDDHTRLGLVGGDDVFDLVIIVMISVVHIIMIIYAHRHFITRMINEY